jgi:hypothetical protein
MARFFRAAIFIAFIFSAKSAFPACHVVTPSGSGSKTGADWNNAYAGLPSTLTRGDVYYLADGTYGSYTFSTPDSGTTVVEIRKAQTYDNCTSTGWNAATMGSSQASFTGSPALSLNSDYFILNGNGTYTGAGCGNAPGSTVTSEPPTPSDCGIRLAGSGNTTSGALNVVACCGLHNTLEYVELVSSGTNNISGNGSLAIFAGISDQSSTFFTIRHMYARNEGCVYIQDIGSDTVVDHSYFWGTEVYGAPGGSACHGQSEYSVNSSRGIRSYNVQRDITGTAVWTFGTGGTFSNWQIYGNIIFMSSPTASWAPFLANGVIACINAIAGPSLCQNLGFYDNTVIAPGNTQNGILSENSPSSYVVRNNLWYNSPVSTQLFYGAGFSGTQDHNSYLVGGTSCPSGTANVCNNASTNPFVNWSAGNFNLASDGANWNNRLSLGAPYDTDAAGNAFTTDRGAHQYSGSVAQVQPPTALRATVQ